MTEIHTVNTKRLPAPFLNPEGIARISDDINKGKLFFVYRRLGGNNRNKNADD